MKARLLHLPVLTQQEAKSLTPPSLCGNAEMTGGALAGVLACPLYGDHAKYLDPLFPWGDKHHDQNTSMHGGVSALHNLAMLTGSCHSVMCP